jgi:TolB protein
MYCPLCRYPKLRRLRSLLAPLLALAVLAALAACDGTDNPLAPDGDADRPLPTDGGAEAVAPVPGDPVALTTGQRIVFTSARKGGYDIFKMDPQGNNVAPLATSADVESAPAWSYDNKQVALVRLRPDPLNNTSHYDICLMNADGSNSHWVKSIPSPYDLGSPSWSPDGSRIVLTVQISGISYVGWLSPTSGLLGIYSAGVGGGLQGREPSYGKTGQIVYVGPTSKTVERMNADGSAHKTLVSADVVVANPHLSPDGKKLAFVKVLPTNLYLVSNPEIFVRNLVDGTVKRLTNRAGADMQPTWSPDGYKLAFMSTRSGVAQIWTMSSLTGDNLVRITHTSTVEKDPAWSH